LEVRSGTAGAAISEMSYWCHPDAESEFIQAIEYYEEIETGLRYNFTVEIYATIQRSLIYPNARPILEGDIRRCLVRRFSYAVLYSIQPNAINEN
jgi:hypothetical protein